MAKSKTAKTKIHPDTKHKYKRVEDKFFSVEIPDGWEARYLQVNGVDQPNMITFRSPAEVAKDSLCPNAATIQYFDREGLLKFDPQEYANLEAGINPGGKTKAKFSVFNTLHGIYAITEDLPFKLTKGKTTIDVWTFYLQNPKNMKLFRISFWCEKNRDKEFHSLFDHMLKSFHMK